MSIITPGRFGGFAKWILRVFRKNTPDTRTVAKRPARGPAMTSPERLLNRSPPQQIRYDVTTGRHRECGADVIKTESQMGGFLRSCSPQESVTVLEA